MKQLNEFITEGREIKYNVAFNDCKNKEDIPISITISINSQDQEVFEKFLQDEEANIFAHASGGNIKEY